MSNPEINAYEVIYFFIFSLYYLNIKNNEIKNPLVIFQYFVTYGH